MKRISLALFVAIVGYAAVQLGCMDRQPAEVCSVPTEVKADEITTGAFDGVDLLVEVDNSGSMSEEQAILATGFFTLINSLQFQLPGWPYAAVENMRVAIITQDMGVSYGEDQSIPDSGDTPASLQAYLNKGDNGKFQTDMHPSVEVQSDVIKCDETAAQCPSGWACGNIDDTGVGVCQSATTTVTCPTSSPSYVESTKDAPDTTLNLKAACLAQQGTAGCGFEQQLQGAAVALHREDQQTFMKQTHLLAVLLVTDEEDCSMEDAPGLFATDECQDATKLNIACNVDEDNESYLFTPEYFYQSYTEAKGNSGAVIFAAIAGVPYGDDDGALECQGTGDLIGQCLEQDAMKMVPYIDSSSGQDLSKFTPACTRSEGGTMVTSAVPGRRYVTLAADFFHKNGYVYSICNRDWSPAMEQVAALIASQIGGTCYDKPLDWDAVNQVAKCNVVAEFDNQDSCPFDLAEGDEPTTETSADGETTNIFCPLPKLAMTLDCADGDKPDDQFGWYYCQNLSTEDNDVACADGIDNDGDGNTDCDDSLCMPCKIACADQNNNPAAEGSCDGDCKYNVSITDEAKNVLTGAPVTVQCLQQFSFEDGNCQEDSEKACNDGKDNDGNGIYDCMNVASGEDAHLADPHCCPMIKEDNGDCNMDVDGDGTPDWQSNCTDIGSATLPDSCASAHDTLNCSW